MLIDDVYFSDHKYIFLSAEMNEQKQSYNKENAIKYIIDYDSIERYKLLDDIQICRTFQEFIDKLCDVINKNRREIVIQSKTATQPWVTIELKKLIKERNKYYKWSKKYRQDNFIKENYKKLKKQAHDLNVKLKRMYFGNKLKDNVNDPKKFWKFLKYATFNVNENSKPMVCINKNNSIIQDKLIIADEFNNFFINIGHNITSNLLPLANYTLHSYDVAQKFTLENVDCETIINIIKNLKSNAACGHDNISTKFLQHFSSELTPTIVKLTNDCIKRRTFPETFKVGKVIPIHKSDKAEDLNNYRPITILSSLSKILERHLNNMLRSYCRSNNIVSRNQFGFVDQSNTESACMELTHFISTTLDKKLYCACIFIDLSKAFDTMNHQLMIDKLKQIGVEDDELKIFISFLRGRKQFVYVNNVSSKSMQNTIGVPQGSILGPLLFTIFINDITKLEFNGEEQLFADDIVLKYKAETQDRLYQKMQDDLTKLETWMMNNKLVLNVKKTKFMIFNNKKVEKFDKLKYNNCEIEHVTKYTYLGLVLSHDMKWDSHIDHIKSKISPYIYAIYKLKNILPKSALTLIYNAYINCHITYLNPIWNGATEFKLKELFILQKRAIKNILNVNMRFSSKNLFAYNIRSLYFIMDEQLILLTYKILQNKIKHNFTVIQRNEIHGYKTRKCENFSVDYFSTEMCRHNVLYKGLSKFNNLPVELKNETSINKFRISLRDYLKSIRNEGQQI